MNGDPKPCVVCLSPAIEDRKVCAPCDRAVTRAMVSSASFDAMVATIARRVHKRQAGLIAALRTDRDGWRKLAVGYLDRLNAAGRE